MLSYLRCRNPLKQSKAEIQRRKIVLCPIFLKKPLFKIHHFCKRLQAAKYKNSNFVGHFRKICRTNKQNKESRARGDTPLRGFFAKPKNLLRAAKPGRRAGGQKLSEPMASKPSTRERGRKEKEREAPGDPANHQGLGREIIRVSL